MVLILIQILLAVYAIKIFIIITILLNNAYPNVNKTKKISLYVTV